MHYYLWEIPQNDQQHLHQVWWSPPKKNGSHLMTFLFQQLGSIFKNHCSRQWGRFHKLWLHKTTLRRHLPCWRSVDSLTICFQWLFIKGYNNQQSQKCLEIVSESSRQTLDVNHDVPNKIAIDSEWWVGVTSVLVSLRFANKKASQTQSSRMTTNSQIQDHKEFPELEHASAVISMGCFRVQCTSVSSSAQKKTST